MTEETETLITDDPKEAKILVVDDRDQNRAAMAAIISDFGYKVCSPGTPRELEEAIAFEVFDSVVADFELSRWQPPAEIIDSKVRNGADVAKRYRDLHKESSGCVYSTQGTLPGPEYDRIIKDEALDLVYLSKLGSLDFDTIREDFTPFFRRTNRSFKSNPFFQQAFSHRSAPPAVKLHVYRRICKMHSGWINLNLKLVGDCAWGVICGRQVQKDFYGPSLEVTAMEFEVKERQTYPTPEEFKAMADQLKYYPFVFWNTRRPDFLRKQFKQAGPGLEDIPSYLHDYFGIAMAPMLADAYVEGAADEAISLCRRLNITGQVETAKLIYRRFRGDADAGRTAEFVTRFAGAGLPRVVETYHARLGGVEGNVAFVEMRDWGSDRARSVEQFNAEKLSGLGLTRVNQTFEYMVYELPNGHPSMDLEPIERVP